MYALACLYYRHHHCDYFAIAVFFACHSCFIVALGFYAFLNYCWFVDCLAVGNMNFFSTDCIEEQL
jgi:hypothetical protein